MRGERLEEAEAPDGPMPGSIHAENEATKKPP
jgi:hypothetical protein